MAEIHQLRVKRSGGVYDIVELDGKPLWTADAVDLHLDTNGVRAEIFLSIDVDLDLEAETTVHSDLVATIEAVLEVLAAAEPLGNGEAWVLVIPGEALHDIRARLAALRSNGAEGQAHG